MSNVSIQGLSKASVLAALYNGAKPQGMGFFQFDPTPITEDEAEEIMNKSGVHFDYLKGRVMKVDLSGDEIDPSYYDRDNGAREVQRIISALRVTGQTNTPSTQDHQKENTKKAALDVIDGFSDEGSVKTTDNATIAHIGLSDVKDLLVPRIAKVLNDQTPIDDSE